MCLNRHMKTFQRVKLINGKEYAYDITPYYDPKTKRIRQKSKYVGKVHKGEVIRPMKPLPKLVYSYGDILPLTHIFKELGISGILEELCKEKNANTIKTLVFNRLIRPLALQNLKSWVEGTTLSKEAPCACSSQTLSHFLCKLGTSSISEHFINRFIKQHKGPSSIAMDITSLSSYSQLNSLLEYGYNRDTDGLPQFNLCLATDRQQGIPLLYDIYSGSIKDVSTIHNSIKRMNANGVDVSALVLDRGFFSTSNLDEMIQNEIPFVIGVPLTLKEAKLTISSFHKEMENPNLARKYEKQLLFVKQLTMKIGEHDLKGFLFYDLKREQEEKNTFYLRLKETKDKLEAIVLRTWMDPQSVFEQTAADLCQYLGYSVENDHYKVEMKENAVSHRVNRMGKMILLCNGDFAWEECLELYRQKDIVEKNFRVLKTSILQSPLNVQKQECVRGWIFILYLALIVRFRLQHLMRTSGLSEQYSVESLLLELEKIKKVELMNGEVITTEITKTQRIILERLGLCA